MNRKEQIIAKSDSVFFCAFLLLFIAFHLVSFHFFQNDFVFLLCGFFYLLFSLLLFLLFVYYLALLFADISHFTIRHSSAAQVFFRQTLKATDKPTNLGRARGNGEREQKSDCLRLALLTVNIVAHCGLTESLIRQFRPNCLGAKLNSSLLLEWEVLTAIGIG